MPNRIIKESALISADLDKLSNGAERLFWRLIVVADDFGRFDASPQVVKARCFPTKVDSLRTKEVETWMNELTPTLVRYYRVSGRPYGFFPNWEKHQQKRASTSKFPDPASVGNQSENTGPDHPQPVDNLNDSICNHLLSNASEIGFEFENKERRKPVNKGPPHGPMAVSLQKEIGLRIVRISALDEQAGRDSLAWVERQARFKRPRQLVFDALGELFKSLANKNLVLKPWAYLDKVANQLEQKHLEHEYKHGDFTQAGAVLRQIASIK